jgi:hypothetical protein
MKTSPLGHCETKARQTDLGLHRVQFIDLMTLRSVGSPKLESEERYIMV